METKITVDGKPCLVQLAEGVELLKTDLTTSEVTQLVMAGQAVTFRAARPDEQGPSEDMKQFQRAYELDQEQGIDTGSVY